MGVWIGEQNMTNESSSDKVHDLEKITTIFALCFFGTIIALSMYAYRLWRFKKMKKSVKGTSIDKKASL